MRVHSTPLIKKQNFLKIIALLLGYVVWRVVSSQHHTTLTLQAPLSFYNVHHYYIKAPESITVTLRGPKKSFINVEETLALHIDVSHLKEGDNEITITSQNLFLPEGVKLIKWNPHYFKITLTKKKEPV